jgi:hypothetical protein
MDQRHVRTSRLPPLSTRENPCLGAGGCRGGFVGGDLFRVSRYVSTGARELVRDIERKMRHCVGRVGQRRLWGQRRLTRKSCRNCAQNPTQLRPRSDAIASEFRRNCVKISRNCVKNSRNCAVLLPQLRRSRVRFASEAQSARALRQSAMRCASVRSAMCVSATHRRRSTRAAGGGRARPSAVDAAPSSRPNHLRRRS